MPARTANARWEGTLKDGKGTMRFGAFEGPYSFPSRFEDGSGTNPEELIGAAHAGCFSMAFSGQLTRNDTPPNRVETTATVHLESQDGGFAITRIELKTEAEVPGIDEAKFQELAKAAKEGCPVSKALAGVQISLDATLASG